MENFDVVEHAYQDLLETDKIREGIDVEEQKSILTRRAAYYLNQFNPNIDLLKKTSGNNILGLSVDIILDKSNGDFWDIATDNGKIAKPVNSEPKIDTSLISRWVQPTKELAEIPVVPSNPIPSSNQVTERLARIEQQINQLNDSVKILQDDIVQMK